MVRTLLVAAAISWTIPVFTLGCVAGWTFGQPPSGSDEQASRHHADLRARYAETLLQLAEMRLRKAERLHAVSPRQGMEIDMRILRLRLDMARLRAETRTDSAFHAFPTDMLQMQIDRLADQLQDMAQRVDNAAAIDRR